MREVNGEKVHQRSGRLLLFGGNVLDEVSARELKGKLSDRILDFVSMHNSFPDIKTVIGYAKDISQGEWYAQQVRISELSRHAKTVLDTAREELSGYLC
jgi:hypothetical protein